MAEKARISLDELEEAYNWVSVNEEEHQASISMKTGKVHFFPDEDGADPEESEDLDERFAHVPSGYELRLGKRLVMRFAAEVVPGLFDEVQHCFRGTGAYGRFKQLPQDHRALDKWFAYERDSIRRAMREWAESEGFEVTEKQVEA